MANYIKEVFTEMKNKKIIVFFMIMALSISLFTACSRGKSTSATIGNIDFEMVGSDALTDSQLEEWFNENYKKEDLSSFNFKDYTYILVGAGEKPSGGYSVEISSVVGEEGSIIINGQVNAPKPDEMVTTALTYPNALIRIPKDSRSISFGEFTNTSIVEDSDEAMEEEGVFVGLADSNSCEIIVNNEPLVYRLSDDVKETVAELNQNDQVKFSYNLNEYDQMVIISIQKIKGE